MSTAKSEGMRSPGPGAGKKVHPLPQGDIKLVRREILQCLGGVVTEAAHQGARYVYDWQQVSEYGRTVTPEAVELANARLCLEKALEYVSRLQNEVGQYPLEDAATESPL